MPRPTETGVIHDIGYRHYSGPRLGRAHLMGSLYLDSLRGAYGLGRSTRSKVMPVVLLVIMILPALVMAVVAIATKADELPLRYTTYAMFLQVPIIVFLASQAPALVSRDLRYKVMPLYFSRPLVRADYVLAKVAAMATALFALIGIPLVVLYVGALLGKLPFWVQTRGFTQGLVGALILSVVLASIGLLIASLAPRRGFGVAAVITVLLMNTVVSGVLVGVSLERNNPKLATYLSIINPIGMVDGVQMWLLGSEPMDDAWPMDDVGGAIFSATTVLVVALCLAGLRLRYRKVSAS